MYACVCMSMYVCMCMCKCLYVCIWVCLCEYVCSCAWMYECVCVSKCICICMHVYKYVCDCICMYIYVYMYVYACLLLLYFKLCVYVCLIIRTYVQMPSEARRVYRGPWIWSYRQLWPNELEFWVSAIVVHSLNYRAIFPALCTLVQAKVFIITANSILHVSSPQSL